MKLVRSFGYALSGLKHCFTTQRNFRLHVLATGIVIGGAAWLRLASWQWIALCICIGLVTGAEMLNTALEKICDHVQPGRHPQIKQVKAIAAGAVLVLACISLVTALIILIPSILDHLKH